MVFLANVLSFAGKYRRIRKYMKSKFIDSLKIHVVGGAGGAGLPKYGGLGGQGGCVYCVGKEGVGLSSITDTYPGKIVKATNGEDSAKKKIIGQPGNDAVLQVPVGVAIYVANEKIGEINEEGETCILARGGPGGVPNNNFLGYEGQSRSVIFDLKLIADVGFVGFPNAGKSTLLKALSRANPKIASYPFTTVRPNIGIMQYDDFRQISLADLPGLIEGAHINIGMGHNFLKHVERTKLLLMIVDIQGFSLSARHPLRSCLETIMLLNKELELYDPELLEKPAVLVVNKMDTLNATEKFNEVKNALKTIEGIENAVNPEFCPNQFLEFEEIIGISAQNKENVSYLKDCIRTVLDIHSEPADQDDILKDVSQKLVERGPKLT